jgi:hypothetical protein
MLDALAYRQVDKLQCGVSNTDIYMYSAPH